MIEFVTHEWWSFFFRWLHIIAGVMWIGHLWYFNFTQTPTMPKIPAELKPGVSKYILPEALFWFRWGAMLTIITGLIVAAMQGELGTGARSSASARTARTSPPSASACGWARSCGSTSGSSSGRTRKRTWAWSKSTPEQKAKAARTCRPDVARQHPAVDPDALLHGIGARLLSISSARSTRAS